MRLHTPSLHFKKASVDNSVDSRFTNVVLLGHLVVIDPYGEEIRIEMREGSSFEFRPLRNSKPARDREFVTCGASWTSQ